MFARINVFHAIDVGCPVHALQQNITRIATLTGFGLQGGLETETYPLGDTVGIACNGPACTPYPPYTPYTSDCSGRIHSDSADVELLCGICMEEPHAIRLTRCSHMMCRRCARQLLVVAASSSCQCPFCRKYIGGFESSSKPCATCHH